MKDYFGVRVKNLRNALEKAEIDGHIVSNEKNIFYLTGFHSGSRLLVSREGSNVLQVPKVDFELAKKMARECQLELVERNGSIKPLIDQLKKLKMKKVSFDSLDALNYIELINNLRDVEFLKRSDLLWNLRQVKDREELDKLRQAAKITDRGMERAYEIIKPGIAEYEVAAEIEYSMRKMGSEGTAFDTIVASGPKSSFPHGGCTERRIERGDLIILDIGGRYGGYRGDLSRSVIVGSSSIKSMELYETVIEAQKRAINAIKEGVRACDIDKIARRTIEKKGYGDFFVHGLGHGVGLDIHEPPLLNEKNRGLLLEGNVVTVEPGIYIKDFGGIRIEDIVLVKKNGVEKLTKAFYEFIV